jgi:ribonucleoside-diphosphate reductase alpha chain
LVDSASYPTKLIAENSHIFRTLGLGYANLGSLIMSYGLPYDSKEGNTIAGSLAALMTGVAYKTSAEVASVKGPFAGYEDARCSHIPKPLKSSNKESMLEVIRAHVVISTALLAKPKRLGMQPTKRVSSMAIVTLKLQWLLQLEPLLS